MLHPIEIVGDEPIGARGGVGQPLLGREAQDGFDLGAHVQQRAGVARLVLDRLQVDDGGQSLHDRAEALLGAAPLLLDQLLLRDVDHEAAQERRAAFDVADDVAEVAEPHDRAVPRDHPVLGVEAPAGRGRAHELGDRALPVVGMDAIGPERRVGEPFLGRVAEDRRGAAAHEREQHGARVGLPDDPVQVGDQAAHPAEFAAGARHRGVMSHVHRESGGSLLRAPMRRRRHVGRCPRRIRPAAARG